MPGYRIVGGLESRQCMDYGNIAGLPLRCSGRLFDVYNNYSTISYAYCKTFIHNKNIHMLFGI